MNRVFVLPSGYTPVKFQRNRIRNNGDIEAESKWERKKENNKNKKLYKNRKVYRLCRSTLNSYKLKIQKIEIDWRKNRTNDNTWTPPSIIEMKIIQKITPDLIQKFKLHNVSLEMKNCILVSIMIYIDSYKCYSYDSVKPYNFVKQFIGHYSKY